MRKIKEETALSRWKAKRDAWREDELLKMRREELDLQRERFERETGARPETQRASRDDIHTKLLLTI